MPIPNSDGISIIQDWDSPHPVAIIGDALVVNQGGNASHYFSCGCEFIFEECIMRICGQYHEERIAYTQSSPRAALEAIAAQWMTKCAGAPVVVPVPETISVVNCAGANSNVTFADTLDRVVIVQDKPFVICATPQIDIEHRTICNETTNTWHYVTVIYTDGVVTSNTSTDSGIACSDPLPFNPDIEQIRRCDATTNTIWVDVVRYMTDPVTNVTTSSLLQSIDTLEACNQTETDKIVTNWLPFCVGGVQWYVAEQILFNNATQTEVLTKIYKQGANGAVVTVAPTGVIVDGECKVESPIPHTYGCIGTRGAEIIPFSFGFDLPNDFGTTDATDTYFHAITDNVNGITYFYPPSTTNPTTPTAGTNVSGIQSFLDSIAAPITYTVNVFNEIVIFFDNPNDESNWEFWLGTITPDSYTNKLAVTQKDLLSDALSYQQVQVVKYQNVDGTFIDRFFIPSGDILIETGLKPNQIFNFGQCPVNPAKESISEIEVCIAGATAIRKTIIDSEGIESVSFYGSDGVGLPTPTNYEIGVCSTTVSINKIPVTARVYQSVVGTITVPANARREALLFNRSNRDILVTWTGTLGGGGTFTVPARGTYSLTLIEDPNEGLFATMVTSLDLYGTGALGANELLIEFKN
jgi:hypothetical protein